MSFTHLQSPTPVGTSAATTGAITLPSVTAGSLIVVSVGHTSESITASVSDDKGNTYSTAVGPIDHSGAAVARGYIFYAKNVAAGTTIITVTFSSAATAGIHASEYSHDGSDVACSDFSSGEQTGTTTPDAGNVDTTSAAGLVYGFFRCVSNVTFTPGASFNNRGSTNRTDAQDRIVSSAANYTVTATYGSNSDSIGLSAAFDEVTATNKARLVGGTLIGGGLI